MLPVRVQHSKSTMASPNIYMNKFDYNCLKICDSQNVDDICIDGNCLKICDSQNVDYICIDGMIYVDIEDLRDFDTYQEYEIHLKASEKNFVGVNQTMLNDRNNATAPPDAVTGDEMKEMAVIHHILNDTSGDVIYVKQKMFINFYHYNMLIPDTNNTYICLFCVETINNVEACQQHVVTEEHKTHLDAQIYHRMLANNIIRHVKGDCFHCGICNIVILEGDLEDHIKTDKKHDTLKKYGEACAEHILKGKSLEVDMNKLVKIQVRDEKIFLHKRHWHMCYLFPRKYFCSLCDNGGDSEFFEDHLESSDHLIRLNRCQILPEYGLSVVRTLSEYYHHCGVCNTYLIVNLIDDHMRHPKHKYNISLWMEYTEQQKIEAKDKEHKEYSAFNEGVKAEEVNVKVAKRTDDPEIFDEDVFVEYEGSKFCFSILSLNTVVKEKKHFYCVCCSRHVEHEQLRDHMNMVEHATALDDTVVMDKFTENFIRKKNYAPPLWAHCGICNSRLVYDTEYIQDHIKSTKHKNNFTKHMEKVSKKNEETTVARTSSKYTIFIFGSTLKKYSQEIEISGQKYKLNLRTSKAWHTIRRWGVYFSCCFVCQTILTNVTMCRHMQSQEHEENLKNCVVLECYGTNFLKVINWTYFVYCTLCNVEIDFVNIDSHIESRSHVKERYFGINKLYKKYEWNSEPLMPLAKLLSQPQGSAKENEALINNGRNPERCESDVKIGHSSHQACDSAMAITGSYASSQWNDKHLIKSSTTEKVENLNVKQSGTCRKFTENEIDENVTDIGNLAHHEYNSCEKKNCKYVIIEFFKDKFLVTFNFWNTILERTIFCNICKVNFTADTKAHCNTRKHARKVKRNCLELPDGSVIRKQGQNLVKCLVCDSMMETCNLHEHIQSKIHLDNLKTAKALIGEIHSLTENKVSSTIDPASIIIHYIQSNASNQNREEYVLLKFGNSKLLLTYNSWNGIVDNRATCCICKNENIISNIESIEEHCNGANHIRNMRIKVLEENLFRKLRKTKFYCMFCNFIVNRSQIQMHVHNEMHRTNFENARLQAAMGTHHGIQIINCSDYLNTLQITYPPVFKGLYNSEIIIVNCDSVQSVTSDNRESKDVYREDSDSSKKYAEPIEITNKLIGAPSKVADGNRETVNISTTGTVQRKKRIFRSYKTAEDDKETTNMSISATSKGDDDEACRSAVSEGDIGNLAAEKWNSASESAHGSNINSVETELCHICGLAVPLQFYTEHIEGEYHKNIEKLIQTVLKRTKNNYGRFSVHQNKSDVVKGDQYCFTCNCTLVDEELLEHSHSNLHKCNANKINVLKQAVRLLESPGNDQLVGNQIEEFMPIEYRSKNGEKITNNVKESEEVNKPRFYRTTLVDSNADKLQHGTDCGCFERNKRFSVNISDANQSKDVEAVIFDVADTLVTLQVEDRKINIDILSYHGVYPGPGDTLWCILCKVKEDYLHLISEYHLQRLNEMVFKGVDLIRYLTAFCVHCGLCHVIVGVADLEKHLNSETHKQKRASSTIISLEHRTGHALSL